MRLLFLILLATRLPYGLVARLAHSWRVWVLWAACLTWAQAALAEDRLTLTLTQAELSSLQGQRSVSLPHRLERADHDASGSRVFYRLSLRLPQAPHSTLGVYVQRISLAGRLWVNGHELQACETGLLQSMRCFNHPQLFRVPPDFWQAGTNEIEFEVFATARPASGLSSVLVGAPTTLESEHFLPAHFWQVQVLTAMGWVSLLLGVLSLWVALATRQATPFMWFGLSCLLSALVKATVLAGHSWISLDFFTWLALASRITSGALLLVAALAFFQNERLHRPLQRALLLWALLAPLALGLGLVDRNSHQVLALYLPLGVLGLGTLGFMARWTWRSRHPLQAVVTLAMVLLMGVSLPDGLHFLDQNAFTALYVAPYAQTAMLVVMAFLFYRWLAQSTHGLQQQGQQLEGAVRERTGQLQAAQAQISAMAQTLLTLTENIPVGTYVIETQPNVPPRFTFVSDRFVEMLGLRRDKLMADIQVGLNHIHPDDRASFHLLGDSPWHKPQPFQWEGRIMVRGQTRWVQFESVPRRLTTGALAWEGVMIDITAQKLAQRELQQTQAKLMQAEVDRSRQQEREQLLQDMHDGFGSQLASARILAESGELTRESTARILQECMADLHLVIDTLGTHNGSLDDALVDFRFRTQQRLASTGLQLHWRLQIEQLPSPPQSVVLHMLRILQEAINNAVQHAACRQIWVCAEHDAQGQFMRLHVSDDGKGLPARHQHGRGLNNMYHRARVIGGQIDVHPSQPGPGTTVELRWPLAGTPA